MGVTDLATFRKDIMRAPDDMALAV